MRVDQIATVQGDSKVYSIWFLFSQQMTVVYDRTNEQCVVSALNGTLDAPVVPADSTFQGSFVIGSQAVDSWYVPEQDDSGKSIALSFFSSCLSEADEEYQY